jgi:hypothetical protein
MFGAVLFLLLDRVILTGLAPGNETEVANEHIFIN